MVKVVLSFILCAVYTGAAPTSATLMHGFLIGSFVMMTYQFGSIGARRHQGIHEPHTYSEGSSWMLWRQFGIQQTAVQRYMEPAACLLVARLVFPVDPFFSVWIGASAVCLFIKHQVVRFRLALRVADMADSRIESQEMSSAVERYLNPRSGQAEGLHRARFPTAGGRQPMRNG